MVDLEQLAWPHRIPAQQSRLDQGELFSHLEKELAALDETPAQLSPQQEQPDETVVTAEPEESQNSNVVQPQKVIDCYLLGRF